METFSGMNNNMLTCINAWHFDMLKKRFGIAKIQCWSAKFLIHYRNVCILLFLLYFYPNVIDLMFWPYLFLLFRSLQHNGYFLIIRYEVQCYGNEINEWFSNAVGQPCTLVRCCHSQYCFSLSKSRSMGMCRNVDSRVNFSNEAQFLLISEESVSDLNNRLCSSMIFGELFYRHARIWNLHSM